MARSLCALLYLARSGLPPGRLGSVAVVAFELLALAYFRYRFFQDTFVRALGIVTFAGVLIVAISAGLGSLLGAPVGS